MQARGKGTKAASRPCVGERKGTNAYASIKSKARVLVSRLGGNSRTSAQSRLALILETCASNQRFLLSSSPQLSIVLACPRTAYGKRLEARQTKATGESNNKFRIHESRAGGRILCLDHDFPPAFRSRLIRYQEINRPLPPKVRRCGVIQSC